uniref:non-specific serine/threonine protein kinase n=1 Tax=Populus alba TaxID=43335 RepID=A0A4U5R4J5_POPAL|nr:putative receptor-like protein kinase [Populus alba]
MSSESLNAELSKKTSVFGLKLWVLIGVSVGVFIISILCALSAWVTFRRKSRRSVDKYSHSKIPNTSKDIKVDRVGVQNFGDHPESLFLTVNDKLSDKNSEKMQVHLGMSKSSDPDNASQCSSIYHHERACSSHSGEEGSSGTFRKQSSLSHAGLVTASPLIGLPEFSHLGWGHWFTLRDLEFATNSFVAENVLGEGGYGVVYKGTLINGTEVAVKKLLNNLMLVYEYVNNGNLEQWLHGAMHHHGILTWEARMKVNLLEWLKMMVGTRRAEEVVDPNLEVKPTTRALKRALLVALRCVDPDAERRPKMTQVVRMLEADEYPLREDRRNRKTRTTSMEIESMREESTESENKGVDSESRLAERTHG